MPNAIGIINLGLGMIAASKVSSITPPRTPLEIHCANGYPTWRDGELEKRDWVVTVEKCKILTLTQTLTTTRDGKKFVYALPNDYLRPLRDKHSEWEQNGQFIYSAYSTLAIDYIKQVNEAIFKPSLTMVVAARVAQECVEFSTQSNTKGETADGKYARYLSDAGKVNAYIRGPQDVQVADENSTWIMGRLGFTE